MALAIFDLDNTLLNGDSDYLWGKFLVERGVVDGDWYEGENQRFYDEYNAGRLDIFEFLRFSLAPLAKHDLATLRAWHADFMRDKIAPIMQTRAHALLDEHRARGDTLLIITATNRFVTEPIARAYGIEDLIATEPEFIDGRYTGEVSGTPCFREGKVKRLSAWLIETGLNLEGSSFYSDSHNDLPLLEMVTTPVAVDPDLTLTDHATARGWSIISLRD
ncbi:MAG: HAD family hydrolase [Granulosicoccaceae bacterium]